MNFSKNIIIYNNFGLNKMFIYVVSLIFILKIFSFSVSAETIDDLSNLKEANFVVKKSGRVFLIHQSEKAERFLNSKQPKKEIESSTNRNSSFQKEIKKVSLRKTKINGIIKSLEQKTFQSAFSQKSFILHVINNVD